MDETLEERLAAVERTLTDGDHDLTALENAGERADRLDDLEAEMDTLDERIAELEAATQALRGYVGNIRATNNEVEQRADLALEKAESALEASRPPTDGNDGHRHTDTGASSDSRQNKRSHAGEDAPRERTPPRTDPTALANPEYEPTPDGKTRTTDDGRRGVIARIRQFV
jgi:septal ring factor EnvC (AmiA/AmiB activator)